MNCFESLDIIFSYIDGEIEDKEADQEIEEHIKHCRKCYDAIEFEQRVRKFIKKSCCDETIPDEVSARALATLEKFKKY